MFFASKWPAWHRISTYKQCKWLGKVPFLPRSDKPPIHVRFASIVIHEFQKRNSCFNCHDKMSIKVRSKVCPSVRMKQITSFLKFSVLANGGCMVTVKTSMEREKSLKRAELAKPPDEDIKWIQLAYSDKSAFSNKRCSNGRRKSTQTGSNQVKLTLRHQMFWLEIFK